LSLDHLRSKKYIGRYLQWLGSTADDSITDNADTIYPNDTIADILPYLSDDEASTMLDSVIEFCNFDTWEKVCDIMRHTKGLKMDRIKDHKDMALKHALSAGNKRFVLHILNMYSEGTYRRDYKLDMFFHLSSMGLIDELTRCIKDLNDYSHSYIVKDILLHEIFSCSAQAGSIEIMEKMAEYIKNIYGCPYYPFRPDYSDSMTSAIWSNKVRMVEYVVSMGARINSDHVSWACDVANLDILYIICQNLKVVDVADEWREDDIISAVKSGCESGCIKSLDMVTDMFPTNKMLDMAGDMLLFAIDVGDCIIVAHIIEKYKRGIRLGGSNKFVDTALSYGYNGIAELIAYSDRGSCRPE